MNHVWILHDGPTRARASACLANAIDLAAPGAKAFRSPSGNVIATRVNVGRNNQSLRWAELDGWHVLAYAEGGYAAMKRVPGIGLTLLSPGEDMPAEVEAALCCALGLDYVPDTIACSGCGKRVTEWAAYPNMLLCLECDAREEPAPAGWSHI